jgi:uncharacterized protein YmfQ (DUF2313 family)
MRAILTDELAQKIIDYVSPIYGNSYVGLWIFQAIGTALSDVYKLGNDLKQETNPLTSTLLLDYWEAHYGLTKDSSLTIEQRRNRIITKLKSRGSCNPARLAEAVSAALGGVEVEVKENVARNTFQVLVLENVDSLDPAITVIERMKPAHLIYTIHIEIRSVPTANMQLAGAMTYSETYSLHEIEYEDTDVIYVDDETLVARSSGVSAEGGSVVFADGIASVKHESLILK